MTTIIRGAHYVLQGGEYEPVPAPAPPSSPSSAPTQGWLCPHWDSPRAPTYQERIALIDVILRPLPKVEP